jgi:hypothetical protein
MSTAHSGTGGDDGPAGTTAPQNAAPQRPTDPSPSSSSTPKQRRKAIVAQQKERYGGVKLGSAFFGWLTATGVTVILIALLVAAGAAVQVATGTDPGSVADQAGSADAATVGLAGGIALLVVVFIAYYCGGYVAGRMARFNGITQGFAVWLWAILIAVVVAVLGAVAGSKYNILANLNSFPRIPVDEGDVTTGGVIALLALAAASLAGALVGGLAGMHFHRQVDKAGLGG